MGKKKKLSTIIILAAFAVNSAGQGYALRPMSTRLNAARDMAQARKNGLRIAVDLPIEETGRFYPETPKISSAGKLIKVKIDDRFRISIRECIMNKFPELPVVTPGERRPSSAYLVPLPKGGIRVYPANVFKAKVYSAVPDDAFFFTNSNWVTEVSAGCGYGEFVRSRNSLQLDRFVCKRAWPQIPSDVFIYAGDDFDGKNFDNEYFDIWPADNKAITSKHIKSVYTQDILTSSLQSAYELKVRKIAISTKTFSAGKEYTREELVHVASKIRQWVLQPDNPMKKHMCNGMELIVSLGIQNSRLIWSDEKFQTWVEIGTEGDGWLIDAYPEIAPGDIRMKTGPWISEGVAVIPLRKGRQIYGSGNIYIPNTFTWRDACITLLEGTSKEEDLISVMGAKGLFLPFALEIMREALREKIDLIVFDQDAASIQDPSRATPCGRDIIRVLGSIDSAA